MAKQEYEHFVDRVLDEENTENITLADENGNEIEMEQVALIPLENGKDYVILHPVVTPQGMEEDEALVFEIDAENDNLVLVDDDEIIKEVFEEYEEL